MPNQPSGTITAPNSVTVSGTAGQTVSAGSFSYSNTSGTAQQIGTVVVTASNPATLASLTVSVNGSGQSVTVTPVTASNPFVFNPAIVVNAGATVSFSVTAQTAGGVSSARRQWVYATMLNLGGGDHDGGSGPIAPLSGGLLLVGLVLLPLGSGSRRRVALIAIGTVVLAVGLAACGSYNHSPQPGYSTTVVSGGGSLTNPIPLSTVSESSAGGTRTSVQQLTAIEFR